MKLKKLIKIAQVEGKKWVSVDKGGTAYSSMFKPEPLEGYWMMPGKYEDLFVLLGKYTGKKDWKNTLRKVGK